jgi:hypothetical protein
MSIVKVNRPRTSLTPLQVSNIRRAYLARLKRGSVRGFQSQYAAKLGVTQPQIRNVVMGISWKDREYSEKLNSLQK